MKKIVIALLSALALITGVSVPAHSVDVDDFKFMLSDPIVQGSQFSNLDTESFDAKTLGACPTPTTWAGGAWNVTITGTGTNCVYKAADNFGGAVKGPTDTATTGISGGTGTRYLALGGDTQLTVSFGSQQRYIGFWYTAGDRNSYMEFYSSGTLVGKFSTAIIMEALGTGFSNPAVPTLSGTTVPASQYRGNPRNNSNTNEPYAFVNIIPNGLLTFDTVIMKQLSGGGMFELDNLVASVTSPNAGFPAEVFPDPIAFDAVQCQAATMTLYDTNFPAQPTYSVSPALPNGLSLNASTGVVSGTPTGASSATNYTFTATSGASSASAVVPITVAAGSTDCVSTLPNTGIVSTPLIPVGVVLLVVGVAVFLAARRRS